MARHKTDADTTRLLKEMATTRSELRVVMEGLAQEGVKQGKIASAAGWNPGYLSEFLKNDQKNPSFAKIDALIQALHAFQIKTAGAGPKVAEPLQRVAERYGRPLAQIANPAAGPLPAAAPNYVRRPDLDDALGRAVAVPGSYAIDGQPMTGVSSALLLVESMLQERGFDVCRISAKNDLLDWERIEDSQTGILGALAAAITRSSEPLAMEFFGVQEAIRDRLSAAPAGFALLVDDMNTLDEQSTASMKSFARDWATRRASGEAAFVNTTVWLAYTSNVDSARFRSHFVAEYVITRWFTKEEVRTLAGALTAFAAATAVERVSEQWAPAAAESAWSLFAGQPQLTHLYLWDRHNDGATTAKEILADPPAGAYQRHLGRVAQSLAETLMPERLEQLFAGLGPKDSIVGKASLGEHQGIERLGVLNESGRWSCAYYQAHLPRLLGLDEDASGAS